MPERQITVLFSTAEIADRVDVLAREIADSMGENLVVVAILKGSFIFTADLLRALHRAGVRSWIDFMTLSSYGTGAESSGEMKIVHDITDPIEGREILLVDDILESGRTLAHAKSALLGRGAAGVKLCVLLDKPGKRKVDIDAEFVGFECPDRFVVGYGLDFAHYWRELPHIGYLEET